MSQKINYYRLTKKELSFISYIQEPVVYLGKRISSPVVIATFLPTGHVSCVYSLSWYRHMVKHGTIEPDFHRYDIFAMF